MKRLLFLGFGRVGRELARIINCKDQQYHGLDHFNPQVVGIVTRSHGAKVNAAGLDLAKALAEFENKSHFDTQDTDYLEISSEQAISQLEYDTLVDLTTLSIKKRGEPSLSLARKALITGRHVVSANKGPAAFAYKELAAMARKHGALFRHEATVMDGAPIFNLVRNSLPGCRILGFSGILNSTTNYILTEMEKGRAQAQALASARQLGFVEADPELDLEGWDAAAKVSVLANVLLDAEITPQMVERQGITKISAREVKQALAAGFHMKLICRASRKNHQVVSQVSVEKIPRNHPFATIRGSGSVLRLETDLMGPILIIQENPSIRDTAFGVIVDLLSLAD